MEGARVVFLHAVSAKTLDRYVMRNMFKKISGTSIDENVPGSTFAHRAKFRGISRFLGVWVKILRGAKRLPEVKNNETITKILKKSRFWLCNRNETVYTNYITGSKEASEARPEARFDRFDSLFIGDCRRCTSNSYFYRRMCGAGAVRGWAAFRTVSF